MLRREFRSEDNPRRTSVGSGIAAPARANRLQSPHLVKDWRRTNIPVCLADLTPQTSVLRLDFYHIISAHRNAVTPNILHDEDLERANALSNVLCVHA